MANTVDELQRALDRINTFSRGECRGVSDRKMLLIQIESIANEALDGLVLSRDEKDNIAALRTGDFRLVPLSRPATPPPDWTI